MRRSARPQPDTSRVLWWSLIFTLLFVGVELAGGIQARSLALVSDAGHNFTDALALLLAWFGRYLARRPADNVKTYGYHRAGVLAALLNALALMGLAGYLLYESYQRWLRPQIVGETTMLLVAAMGLILNLAIMRGLSSERKQDLGVRSAWAHMMGDAMGSAGIIAGAGLIRLTGWQRVDPALSALIALLILWTAWDITREALNILLEGMPRGIQLQAVIEAMRAVPGVIDVHDVHVWSLGSQTHALSCHVLIDDVPPSESESILRGLESVLATRFQIRHTTFQFEHALCAGCPLPARPER